MRHHRAPHFTSPTAPHASKTQKIGNSLINDNIMIIAQFKTKGLQLRCSYWPGQISAHSCTRVKPPKVKNFAILAFETSESYVCRYLKYLLSFCWTSWLRKQYRRDKNMPCWYIFDDLIFLFFIYWKRRRKMEWYHVFNSIGLFAHVQPFFRILDFENLFDTCIYRCIFLV